MHHHRRCPSFRTSSALSPSSHRGVRLICLGLFLVSPALAWMGPGSTLGESSRAQIRSLEETSGEDSGVWTLEPWGKSRHEDGGYLQLRSDRGHWQVGVRLDDEERSELEALGGASALGETLGIHRSAGTFLLTRLSVSPEALSPEASSEGTSSRVGFDAWGSYVFEPDVGFLEAMEARGFSQVKVSRELSLLAGLDFTTSFVDAMKARGFSEELERLVEMKIHGVSEDFVDELATRGYRSLDARQLVAMRIHGVTPEFISEVEALGYRHSSAERLIELRVHGVDLEAVRVRIASRRSQGQSQEESLPDLSEVVAWSIHGVTAEFVASLEAAGYGDLDDDQLVAFRIHGVTVDFVDEMAAAGFEGASADDLVGFRIHGVTPSFIAEMARLGYRRLSADDLTAFRVHGVKADFIEDLSNLGYDELAAADLIAFRVHGVTPQLIGDLEKRGLTGLSPDELVAMKIHGLDRSLDRRASGRDNY